MSVVFPAPFGPNKPKTSPERTASEQSRRALSRPYVFVRFSVSTTTQTFQGYPNERSIPDATKRSKSLLTSGPTWAIGWSVGIVASFGSVAQGITIAELF